MTEKQFLAVAIGLVAGVLARVLMLRTDYRHYPTYPHGYVTHLSLGVIASLLGAVAVPALAKPDYTAVTFLVLAAQQFRDVRNMERQTLATIDELRAVPRGTEYIEGIARVFEARNYLVMMTSLVTTAVCWQWGWVASLVAGLVTILLATRLMGGEFVGAIARVRPAEVRFEKSLLMVENIVIMNVGLDRTREQMLRDGRAVILEPVDDDARLTLETQGQRQAIIHDVATILGSKKDLTEPDLAPLARRDLDTGRVAVFSVPNEPDVELMVEVVKRVPVIESCKGRTLASRLGRKAAD